MSPETVPIACPRCKTRITVPATAAGSTRQCPGCRTDFLVTRSMLRLQPEQPENAGEEEDYAVQAPPPPQTGPDLDRWTTPSVLESPEETTGREGEDIAGSEDIRPSAAWKTSVPPPWWLFTGGLAAFLGDSGAWMRALTLGFWMLISLSLLHLGLLTSSAAAAGNMLSVVASVLFTLAGLILHVPIFMLVAAYGLAVLLDSSDGLNVMVNWPRGFLTDWLRESFYLLAALLWGLLPGGLASYLFPWPVDPILVYAAGEAVFFPIMLLSALDGVTPALPSSAAVWKSLFRHAFVWLWFYALSIPLLILIVWLYSSAVLSTDFYRTLLASASAAGWFVYFRLLGRLAWYCSGRYEQMKHKFR
jgi:hypothetical protein